MPWSERTRLVVNASGYTFRFSLFNLEQLSILGSMIFALHTLYYLFQKRFEHSLAKGKKSRFHSKTRQRNYHKVLNIPVCSVFLSEMTLLKNTHTQTRY